MIDTQGRVVGIVTLKARKEEGHGYCIPVDALVRSLVRASESEPGLRRRVERRHDIQSVLRTLDLFGDQYQTAALLLVSAREASANDTIRAVALAEAHKKARDEADTLYNRVIPDYSTALARVLDDPETGATIRDNLRELRGVVGTLRDAVKRADGMAPSDFVRTCSTAAQAKKKLVEQLAADLGLPAE